MPTTKKPTSKKAKAPAKQPAASAVKRAPRKQPVRVTASAQLNGQQTMVTLMLVSLFAVLSVLFAALTYWRYRM